MMQEESKLNDFSYEEENQQTEEEQIEEQPYEESVEAEPDVESEEQTEEQTEEVLQEEEEESTEAEPDVESGKIEGSQVEVVALKLLERATKYPELLDEILSDDEVRSVIENDPALKGRLDALIAERDMALLNEEPPDPVIDPEGYEQYMRKKVEVELRQQMRAEQIKKKVEQIERKLLSDKTLYEAVEKRLNSMPDDDPVKIGLIYAFQNGMLEPIERFINQVESDIKSKKKTVPSSPKPVRGGASSGQVSGSGDRDLEEFFKFMMS